VIAVESHAEDFVQALLSVDRPAAQRIFERARADAPIDGGIEKQTTALALAKMGVQVVVTGHK
jgi:pentose-5-phosphate-3-epimerase